MMSASGIGRLQFGFHLRPHCRPARRHHLRHCRHGVVWRACLAYSATGIPAAALGARTLLALPSHAVDIAIALFLIAMVPVRHWLARHQLKAQLLHLAVGGAIIGYLPG